MQEIRHDCTENLTANPTPEQVTAAIADEHNRTVAIHKPGARFKSCGQWYRVAATGALEREPNRKQRKQNRRQQKAARKRSR